MNNKHINNKLESFAKEELVLVRNETERQKITKSLEYLKGIINNKLSDEISEIFPFGSYTRNTILPRKYYSESDVDLMVVFKYNSHSIKKPDTYRTKLIEVLEETYSTSNSKRNFPCVQLELNHIMFDIVPAWYGNLSYHIPSRQSNSNWIDTNPNDLILKNDITYNVIRLCKFINAIREHKLESYPMEKQIVGMNLFSSNTYDGLLSALELVAKEDNGLIEIVKNIRTEQFRSYKDEIKWLNNLFKNKINFE